MNVRWDPSTSSIKNTIALFGDSEYAKNLEHYEAQLNRKTYASIRGEGIFKNTQIKSQADLGGPSTDLYPPLHAEGRVKRLVAIEGIHS